MSKEIHIWRVVFGLAVAIQYSGSDTILWILLAPIYCIGVFAYRRWKRDTKPTK